MILIGMLDSPYVRRCAVSFECLGVSFEHKAVSVFSTYAEFKQINPVVKAPSLICKNGDVLMDSTLIIQYVERLCDKSLWSKDQAQYQLQMRIVGLALAACEKTVQTVYERNLRPKEAQYEPWMKRVGEQLLAAYAGLEDEIKKHKHMVEGTLNQASITTAIAWQCTQTLAASSVPADNYPHLVQLSARLEKTPEFLKYPPIGPGVKKTT